MTEHQITEFKTSFSATATTDLVALTVIAFVVVILMAVCG